MLFIFIFQSCNNHDKPVAFYYWRSVYDLTPEVRYRISEMDLAKIYLRYFDVIKESSDTEPKPVSIIQIKDTPPVKVVPVIFISNEVFKEGSGKTSLPRKIASLVRQISDSSRIGYDQIQIDCDWTEMTRNTYFQFLKDFKEISGLDVSVTIRLHQVKYKEKTGVPPADEFVLMFYNMGSFKLDNSYMFSEGDAKKYVSYIGSYPHQLIPALPYYEQAVCYRDGRPFNIIKPDLFLSHKDSFIKRDTTYIASASFFASEVYIKKGDVFKVESGRNETVLKAADLLSSHLKYPVPYVIFFDLPHDNLNEEQVKKISKSAGQFN